MKSRYTFRLGPKHEQGLEFLYHIDSETTSRAISMGSRLLSTAPKYDLLTGGRITENDLVAVQVLRTPRPIQMLLPLEMADSGLPLILEDLKPRFTGLVPLDHELEGF